MSRNAVVWILTREYFEEVKRSADSVKQYLSDADRILLSPDKYEGNHFTQVIKVNERKHEYWYLDEVSYFTQLPDLPYDKIIFLDSDMLLVNDCSSLWDLLERCDIAMAHAPTRETAPPPHLVPLAYTEFCTGIVAFRNSEKVRAFFWEWYTTYLSDKENFKNNDQVPLRETLWDTEISIKVVTLPPEWNCRFGLGGHAIRPVRILHGRYGGDMKVIEGIVNSTIHPRVWAQGSFPSK